MTLENTQNKQEEAVVDSVPKPFDPNDEARIAELNKKFEKQEQAGSDNFTTKDGLLTVDIDRIESNSNGLITFKASQVDKGDTTTQFKGGLSRDIKYAVFKQGSRFGVQKIFNPGGTEFVQDVRGDEEEFVLRSPTVVKYLQSIN